MLRIKNLSFDLFHLKPPATIPSITDYANYIFIPLTRQKKGNGRI